MIDKEKSPNVMVGGLTRCGKTALICGLIQLGFRSNLSLAALKPFDIGLIKRNASEEPSDGELFCRNMTGEPMEILVSPYVANESYPIEMAFRRDGIRINWGFLNERLGILNSLYNFTMIELPGSLYTSITEEKTVSDWLRESRNRVIWLINPSPAQFEQNLAEISLLKSLELEVDLVMNNINPVSDQDLLFYMWEKIERLAEQEIVGMIPHIKHLDNDYIDLGEKIAAALPGLIDGLMIPQKVS